MIEIAFNSDGLDLFKSSKLTSWPVLIKLLNVPDEVIFVAQIYVGPHKPSSCHAYLKNFVEECNELAVDGIKINEVDFEFKIKYAVFDLPAKSFVLNIAGHNGLEPCMRCNVKGETLLRRKSFAVKEKLLKCLKPRNARDFRENRYSHLQKGSSPISELLWFDPVNFVVIDYMHQICLGIVKNMIKLWLNRKDKIYKNKKFYMINSFNIDAIDSSLKQIRKTCPKEFSRKCREISDVVYWKATEFRMFLLYTGPIILREYLTDKAYKHFAFAFCYSIAM